MATRGRSQQIRRRRLRRAVRQGSDSITFFRVFAHRAAELLGSPYAFIAAVGTILVWAAVGPHYGYSDTWQLIINTGTTIVTFLMVFLIQNTQNRDALAIHLKLDELIRGVKGARSTLVNLEELSDQELAALQEEFRRLHERTGEERTTRSTGARASRAP